jgi:hypothetical protein
VCLSPKAKAAYNALKAGTDMMSVRQRTQLDRYMERFCASEPHYMTDTHYRKEGNHPDGNGGKVPIWAFKPDGWRLYGAVLIVDGKKTFVGVEVDPAKKQRKADQSLLKSAALIIGGLQEY